MSKYHFTSDWFSNNIPLWERELAKFRNKPINFLEIGTYEGRSAIWALENILTHRDSKIYCVDTFQEGTYQTYKKNVAKFGDKVFTLKGQSRDMLKLPHILQKKFDIIYIDSDAHSSQVLEDAVLAFPLLKPGGLLIFDDYTYSKQRDNRCPKQGIDAFLNAYAEFVHVVSARWQVIVQKNYVPRHKKPCRSEFYDPVR